MEFQVAVNATATTNATYENAIILNMTDLAFEFHLGIKDLNVTPNITAASMKSLTIINDTIGNQTVYVE